MSARCDHTDLLVDECAHCRPVPELAPLVAERTIAARHPGRCPSCDGAIEVGDPIGLVEREWLCSGCALTDPLPHS